MPRFKTEGQNLTELALCLAMVVALIMTMRVYIQRSLQAKYKAGAGFLTSEIKSHAAAPGGIINATDTDFAIMKQQYDPYYRESEITETRSANSKVGFPETKPDQTITRTGWERANSALDAD